MRRLSHQLSSLLWNPYLRQYSFWCCRLLIIGRPSFVNSVGTPFAFASSIAASRSLKCTASASLLIGQPVVGVPPGASRRLLLAALQQSSRKFAARSRTLHSVRSCSFILHATLSCS